MLKKTRKFTLNHKILKFFLIPTILVSTPFFGNIQDTKAQFEFQWDQNSGYKKLKYVQRERKRNFRNKIYFFFRPVDRNNALLKLELAIPKHFKSTLKSKNISFCRVKIGGYETRTKCLEDIPADIEIKTNESSLRKINIYPYSPIPTNKESYAIVLKVINPRKKGLYQFHTFGQPVGKSVKNYLGSSTIVID
jgi:hypothetical protein